MSRKKSTSKKSTKRPNVRSDRKVTNNKRKATKPKRKQTKMKVSRKRKITRRIIESDSESSSSESDSSESDSDYEYPVIIRRHHHKYVPNAHHLYRPNYFYQNQYRTNGNCSYLNDKNCESHPNCELTSYGCQSKKGVEHGHVFEGPVNREKY